MLYIALMLVSMLAPSGVTLTIAPPTVDGIVFTVQTDVPRRFYAEIDTSMGVTVEPQIFMFGLLPGETFAQTMRVVPTTPLHSSPEYVRVRVWGADGGEGPVAEQRIDIAFPPPQRFYLPLLYT